MPLGYEPSAAGEVSDAVGEVSDAVGEPTDTIRREALTPLGAPATLLGWRDARTRGRRNARERHDDDCPTPPRGGGCRGRGCGRGRGCAGGDRRSHPAAARNVATDSAASGAALYCAEDLCYPPSQFRVAYGIQPLLNSGIDGRGETVTVLDPVPTASDGPSDIRQDFASFDRMFRLPAARIEVVTSLAGSASRWQATEEEVNDTEIVHAVAPGATLRVVLFPSSWSKNAATATADMLAGLRLALSHTDVASISWSLGEHYFTTAQVAAMQSILTSAEARHVTVVGSSGDGGMFSTNRGWGGPPVKEVSPPASNPLVLGVGGTTLTANSSTGAYMGETAWTDGGGGFSHLYARPAYQNGVPGIGKTRGVPDVSGDADEGGGMARVVASGGQGYLESDAGTSDSAPLWRNRGVGRPVRPPRPWPCQPRHLPHRPQLQLPHGVPRRYDRVQRPLGHPRMGPGNGLGNTRHAGARTAARPLRQSRQDVARVTQPLGARRWVTSGWSRGCPGPPVCRDNEAVGSVAVGLLRKSRGSDAPLQLPRRVVQPLEHGCKGS